MGNSKPIYIFDITKFILAFFVVAIHTGFLGNIMYPWLRIAVPLFFIISSYLFFQKQNSEHDELRKKQILKNYVIRNLKLYLFWFVTLFPFIVNCRQKWFNSGLLNSIFSYIKHLLFGSTFVASWFIMAMIISVIIIFYLSRKLNNSALLILTIAVYLLAALSKTYRFFLNPDGIIIKLFNTYELFFSEGINSFPAALVWCVIGKIFAENKRKIPLAVSGVLAVLSCVLCFIEWKYVYSRTGYMKYDCYISLIPLCALLFDLLKRIKISKLKFSKQVRNASTIIFASHGAIISLVSLFMQKYNIDSTIFKFFVVSACALILSAVILLLENKKNLSVLKYSH